MTECRTCGTAIGPSRGARPRKFCSERCRKLQYSRPCVDCGRPLNGSDGRGPHAPTRCPECAHARQKAEAKWNPAAIIRAVQDWARDHDGEPPTATDWTTSGPTWPSSSWVLVAMGSWNAAIAAAGLRPRPVGHYGRAGEDPRLCQHIAERYDAGEKVTDLARELDCAPVTIYNRIQRARRAMAA